MPEGQLQLSIDQLAEAVKELARAVSAAGLAPPGSSPQAGAGRQESREEGMARRATLGVGGMQVVEQSFSEVQGEVDLQPEEGGRTQGWMPHAAPQVL